MTRLQAWSFRLAYTTVSLSIGLAMRLVMEVPSDISFPVAALCWITTFLVFECTRSHFESAYNVGPVTKAHSIRVRVAEIDEKIEADEAKKRKLLEQLVEAESDPLFSRTSQYETVENELLGKIAKLDREIDPKRKKRAKLNAEFDELLQKKGYRGSP